MDRAERRHAVAVAAAALSPLDVAERAEAQDPQGPPPEGQNGFLPAGGTASTAPSSAGSSANHGL